MEAFPESRTGGIDSIESLHWVEQKAGEGYVVMHLIQIVNKPH